MYLTFYGLNEKPFNATPDPKFLFLTPAHREALAHLIYGVQEGKGFIVLTGEVGTGKTTLLHTLLRRLDRTTAVAFVTNSTLPFDDVVAYMLEDFGIAKAGSSRVERLVALNQFLIERRRAGQNTVLILDEAQNLTPETLEQVRLLSNFETPTDKLLQILVVGQPELKAKLRLPELRQLKQRIGLRCGIRPLTNEEVGDYIRSRLRVAGAPDLRLFTDRSVARIAEYAGGIPRLVNILCDHCLLVGYVGQKRKIEREIVEQAIEYLEEGQRPTRGPGIHWRPQWKSLGWGLGGLGAVILGGLGVSALGPGAVESTVSGLLQHLLNLARDARELVVR
jgi:general secretion pathway protein A